MLIEVDKLVLPKYRKHEIHKQTEEHLMKIPPEQWNPIYTNGNYVVDGLQRVLVARKHNIKSIPCLPTKGS